MYYIVTGAAGFIGSNIVKALNQHGISNIVAVDDLTQGDKCRNLADCDIADYMDRGEFIEQVNAGHFDGAVEAVLHQGACSDTMESDGRFMMENNYRYSLTLLDFCLEDEVPFLYASSASVYGGGSVFREMREYEAPLNVYGPREQHKGRMASVAFHHFNQYRETGKVKLFEGSGGYGNGEQRRDFVYVGDVVNANLDFLDHPQRSGIFNLGTGRAQTFNELAAATVNACRALEGQPVLSLADMVVQGTIEYIPFPEQLKGKYQSFTEADLSVLRAAGYSGEFSAVEEGVEKYARWLAGSSKR